MLSEADILKRVDELRANGSPASQVQLKQLEWVLGISDDTDNEEEELLNFLLTNRAVEPYEELWSKLPSWVRQHKLYTFSKQDEAVKKASDPNGMPLAPVNPDNKKGLHFFSLEELAKLGADPYAVEKSKKKFSWKTLLGKKLKYTKPGNTYPEYEEGFYTRIPDVAADIEEAELIASLQENGKHKPLLDIDFEAVTIESSTPGHCHLYINKELDWKDYKKLLNLLADLGIIEHGYRGASLARGYSALRLPWVKKVANGELDEKEIIAF